MHYQTYGSLKPREHSNAIGEATNRDIVKIMSEL
jgi:hypothetical protein